VDTGISVEAFIKELYGGSASRWLRRGRGRGGKERGEVTKIGESKKRKRAELAMGKGKKRKGRGKARGRLFGTGVGELCRPIHSGKKKGGIGRAGQKNGGDQHRGWGYYWVILTTSILSKGGE